MEMRTVCRKGKWDAVREFRECGLRGDMNWMPILIKEEPGYLRVQDNENEYGHEYEAQLLI